MTAALLVTYAAAPGGYFDLAYYGATHMPLVAEKFGPHGYTGAIILSPDEDAPKLIGAVVLTFRDASARSAALSSAEAAVMFGDIPNFTNITPNAQPFTIID